MCEESGKTSRPMPLYQCHKKVWALKIKRIEVGLDEETNEPTPVSCSLIFEEKERFEPIEVGVEYLAKHNPKPGGYYVVYEDGYNSFSPAKAFEEGYTPIK